MPISEHILGKVAQPSPNQVEFCGTLDKRQSSQKLQSCFTPAALDWTYCTPGERSRPIILFPTRSSTIRICLDFGKCLTIQWTSALWPGSAFVLGKGLNYQVLTNESTNSKPTLKSESQELKSSFRPC